MAAGIGGGTGSGIGGGSGSGGGRGGGGSAEIGDSRGHEHCARLAVGHEIGLDVVQEPVHLREMRPQSARSASVDTDDRQPSVRVGGGYAAAPSSETASSATSVGVRPTRTPLLSSASAFALAVPREPDTIAPA